MSENGDPTTVYERVGGAPTFVALVQRFYAAVSVDPLLRPLYPDDDLEGARERLTGFLIQYWGGPDDYSKERGHPRLRMRHAPYIIGPAERDAWYRHMSDAVRAGGFPAPVEETMLGYFEMAADAMMNVG